MAEPSPSGIQLSPTRLAALRRRTGDHGDRTLIQACAAGLAYWATGTGREDLGLTPATPFPELLDRIREGAATAGAWRIDERTLGITVPPGVDPAAAQRALDDLADFPHRPLGTIGPSGPRERAAELARWNDTRADRARPTVMELFREQARLRPDAVAVVDERRSLTYRETAERSAQLAHHLVERGLAPEQVVGISLGRSAEMVVGLLAVLQVRRVRPPRSAVARRPPGLRRRGRPDRAPAQHHRQGGQRGTGRRRRRPGRLEVPCPPGRRPRGDPLRRRPGLRDLHLRFHRLSPRGP